MRLDTAGSKTRAGHNLVRGGFGDIQGTVAYDSQNVATSNVVVEIDASTISTGELRVKGDVTILGVTKEVILDVEGPYTEEKDPYGNIRIGTSATANIRRSEFGLTWSAPLETGGILVPDDLKINLEVSLIKGLKNAYRSSSAALRFVRTSG